MEGGGEFRNGHGFNLKGLFKNNLYNNDNKMFLNPFDEWKKSLEYIEKA